MKTTGQYPQAAFPIPLRINRRCGNLPDDLRDSLKSVEMSNCFHVISITDSTAAPEFSLITLNNVYKKNSRRRNIQQRENYTRG
jgi:hypothetical protein